MDIIIGVALFIGAISFLIFRRVFALFQDIICSSTSNYQIRFFENGWSDIMKSSAVAPGWLTFSEIFIPETSRPFTYMIIESAVIKTYSFNADLFSDCRLIRLLCYFIALFILGGLLIGFFISDNFNSMIIRMVISYVSFVPLCALSILNYSTKLMVK